MNGWFVGDKIPTLPCWRCKAVALHFLPPDGQATSATNASWSGTVRPCAQASHAMVQFNTHRQNRAAFLPNIYSICLPRFPALACAGLATFHESLATTDPCRDSAH